MGHERRSLRPGLNLLLGEIWPLSVCLNVRPKAANGRNGRHGSLTSLGRKILGDLVKNAKKSSGPSMDRREALQG